VASALGHYAARSSSQRLFNFLGSVHDLEALVTSRSAGSTMRALLLGHWLHLAVVLCWFAGIVVHTGFQANLDLWLDNPVRFGSIAHALWDPHFGSATFPVNELSASGFPFWARSVGFVAGGQLLAFGGALEAGSMASALLTSQPGRAFPFRCSAALLSTLSLLWAGHLSWVAAAPRPAQLLSFVGDLSPLSHAILLTDIIHHHVAVAVIGLWVSLSGAFGLAAGRSWLNSTPSGRGQLNRQVAVACLFLAFVVFWNAHIMLWLPSAGWIHFSLFSCNALFVHHLWIGSALAVGSCVHFSIAGIMPTTRALVPHLSWIGLFLGFHTLGIYVHNDVVFAFGDASKALLIQPIVVQSLQSYAGCFQWAANFCPADFLVQHAVALGIHTSLLILLQGGLSASRLDPDKRQRGFGFACDGPGRGGTCDISGWDSVYLASFWVLNTLGWLSFYEHWRSIVSLDAFCSTGSTLCGWFRDYLWLNSGNLVNGFSFAGSSELAVLAWGFLLAHLIWATSFMFLISWRGYWQELIESLLFVHLKTPVVATMWTAGFTPVALSILQARFVGLAHFTVGFIGTFAAFLLST